MTDDFKLLSSFRIDYQDYLLLLILMSNLHDKYLFYIYADLQSNRTKQLRKT